MCFRTLNANICDDSRLPRSVVGKFFVSHITKPEGVSDILGGKGRNEQVF